MKNIWILNHYATSPDIGQWSRHYKFAEYLIQKGHSVKIFAASTIHNTDKNLIKESIKYLTKEYNGVLFIFIKACDYVGNGKKRIMNMFDYALRLMSVSKNFDNEKPDVIYASSAHPLTWISGYRLAKRYNAMFIAETRDLWPETLVDMGKIDRNSLLAKLLYKLEKFIYMKADRLVFTMPGGKDYVESIGLDPSKVRYINNGVDLEEFNENASKCKYIDEELENDKQFKVIYAGSMGIANSLNDLIESAKIVQTKGYKNIRYILFGDGYQKQELMEYVRVNNISNVIFKGKVEKKYIPGILKKANLNVFTGKNIELYKYGLSLNKMFDYFASGKPILSNIECGYDIVKQYNCGKTVKGGSAEVIAEGIIKFYDMPKEKYETYCINALKAAKDFEYKILAGKLEEVILEK